MRENYVALFGQVAEIPVVSQGAAWARIIIRTYRVYRTGNGSLDDEIEIAREDMIPVYTRNTDIIKKHIYDPDTGEALLEENDLVFIKGTISTKYVNKGIVCPHCKERIVLPGVQAYVDPQVFIMHRRNISLTEAREILVKHRELTNVVHVSGRLTSDPEYYEREKDADDSISTFMSMGLAADRIRRIEEDPEDKTTDFPWVKVYGKRAIRYKELDMFHKGSEVYINGSIQTRAHIRRVECPECGQITTLGIDEGTRPQVAFELVPYRIEGLRDCTFPEHENDSSDETE